MSRFVYFSERYLKNYKISRSIKNCYLFQKLSYLYEHCYFYVFSYHEAPKFLFFKFLRKHKPLIFHFHILKNRLKFDDFFLLNIHFLVKQFEFFNKSKICGKRLKLKFFNFNLKNFKINVWFFFFVLQRLFFKKYYRFFSFVFFKKIRKSSFTKFNFIFFIFFRLAKGYLKILDLGKFYDWCLFNGSLFKVYKHKIEPNRIDLNIRIRNENKKMKHKYIIYLTLTYNKYKKNYSHLTKWLMTSNLDWNRKSENKSGFFGVVEFTNIFLLMFREYFSKRFANNLVLETSGANTGSIQFADSSMNKYITYRNLEKFYFLYIRKNRIFNKSRYSRNRQLYRTGFYWCLWLNILVVYGLFFVFYRFTFNFGYMWWGMLALLFSFIFSKVCKYNFYNIFTLSNEFWFLTDWFGCVFAESLKSSWWVLRPVFLKSDYTMSVYENLKSSNLYISFSTKILDRYGYWWIETYFVYLRPMKAVWFVTLWVNVPFIDKSFLRYRTILHVAGQLMNLHRMV